MTAFWMIGTVAWEGPVVEMFGDPVAMRAAAARLQLTAETLGTLAALVDDRVGAMRFAGPAADRFRGEMSDRHAQLLRQVSRLQDLSETLLRAAVGAEEAQRAQLGAAGGPGAEPGALP